MSDAQKVAEQFVKRWFCQDNEIIWERGGHYKEEVAALTAALDTREREVRREYEWIMKEIVEWGMQTESSDLDLTTAEFGEIWRGAEKFLAKTREGPRG